MYTIDSTLRLFNSIQVRNTNTPPARINIDFLKICVENGFVFDPRIELTRYRAYRARGLIGLTNEQLNSSFHKSWAKVAHASMEQLVLEQILHYITTYGFENLGIFDEDTVYIPNESLEIPEYKGIRLTVIKARTANELFADIVSLAESGIALSEESVQDIMRILVKLKPGIADITYLVESSNNNELNTLLYAEYDITPSDPVEWLRHVINGLTGETLLIKNRYLIEKIKESNGTDLDKYLYDAPGDLASIFLRYKPLFLALKSISGNKTFFNRLRKNAKSLHQPLQQDYLSLVTSNIKKGELDISKLTNALNGKSVFRKIRLGNALNFRFMGANTIMYHVRNGRGYVTDFSWEGSLGTTLTALNLVLDSIATDINTDGRDVYIPSYIDYALPASQKQFVGNLPLGTYVEVPKDMIFGIHWFDHDYNRVDLDLALTDSTGHKFGWDGSYRNLQDILFSGDLTSAPRPKGSSELFYVGSTFNKYGLVTVNYYNYQKDNPVDAKIIVGKDAYARDNFKRKYMVNKDNVLAQASISIPHPQSVIGLVTVVDGKNRFYFYHANVGNTISARGTDISKVRDFFAHRLVSSLSIRETLLQANVNVVGELTEGCIDLSPENLTKTSFLELLGCTS